MCEETAAGLAYVRSDVTRDQTMVISLIECGRVEGIGRHMGVE